LRRSPQHFDTDARALKRISRAGRVKILNHCNPTKATMRISTYIRRWFTAAAFAVCAMVIPMQPAHAAEYTDLWITTGEEWGVNFIQWDNIIYATFYVYGPDTKPIWYAAVMLRNAAGSFSGDLFYNQGTYFVLPWNQGDKTDQVVGTATFTPSTTNNYQGNLFYSVSGAGPVNKSIRRLTVAAVPLAGSYYGGESGAYSGCNSSADNITFVDSFPLTVTQTASTLTLAFAYEGLKTTCTLAGTLAQNGLLYSIPSATYSCTDGLSTTAAFTDIKQTAQGIEGKFTAPVPGGCLETTRFSAVRQ
jgi:hypothetical protein